MQLIGPNVFAPEPFRRRAKRALHLALVDEDARARRMGGERRPRVGEIGRFRSFAPFDAERPHRGLRLLLALRDNADEVADGDRHDNARQMRDRRLVDPDQRTPDMIAGIESGVRRPHDPTVQHAGNTHVVHINEPAGRLGRKVDAGQRRAHDPSLRGGLHGNVVGERETDARPPDQFAVGHTAIVVRLRPDDSVLDHEVGRRDAKGFRRPRDKEMARLRGGAPQRPRAQLDRLARNGRALVRRDGAVAEHHRDPHEGDVQLLGDDLRQRRSDACAEIDMAAEGRHLAGSRDDDERFERLRIRAVHVRAGALGMDDSERSWLLQIVRATEPLRLERRHARAIVAASLTAATISTCAPQRQRLKRSASRISASVGSGLASISARAVMIMPLRQ